MRSDGHELQGAAGDLRPPRAREVRGSRLSVQPCASWSQSTDLWVVPSLLPSLPSHLVVAGSRPRSAEFGGQEPGDAQEILSFVSKYGVTFPMFEKIDVNGPNTHPLFKHLKAQKGELLGDDIKWNVRFALAACSPQLAHRCVLTAACSPPIHRLACNSLASSLSGRTARCSRATRPPRAPSRLPPILRRPSRAT